MTILQSIPENIRPEQKDNPYHRKSEVSENGLAISEKEYWETYYHNSDFHYEWNNGYLEEKPVTDYAGYLMYKWFLMILDHFLMVCPIAKMIGLEFGFRLALPRKTTIRKPDLGVVLNSNPVIMHIHDATYAGTFDLCIESLSHSSSGEVKRDTVIKKQEYEAIGVKEYYILDAKGKETAFYQMDKKGKYRYIKPIGDDIIESEVLPGFQFRISDLYHQPLVEKLTEDEVYKGYVLPFYQDMKQSAEQERLRAEQEKQRADNLEQELISDRKRLTNLEIRLRQLGISTEDT